MGGETHVQPTIPDGSDVDGDSRIHRKLSLLEVDCVTVN